MSKSDIFNREVKANRAPRNAFGTDYSTIFSSPAGLILPAYVQDVKRNTKVKLGVSNLTRTQPLVTSPFMSFDEKLDFWFVPYRLIWSDYDNWRLAQTFNNKTTDLHEVGKQNFLPFCSFADVATFMERAQPQSSVFDINTSTISHAIRLLDLLNYGVPNSENVIAPITGSTSADRFDNQDEEDAYNAWILHYNSLAKVAPMNYFKLAAYQCVYMHCYRNEDYEVLDPSYYNVDNLFPNLRYNNAVLGDTYNPDQDRSTPSRLAPILRGEPYGSLGNVISMDKLFTPRFKNWRKDIFTSAKPDSGFAVQQGTGLQIGLDTSAQSNSYGSGFYWPTSDPDRRQPVGVGFTDTLDDCYNPLDNLGSGSYNDTRLDWTYQYNGVNPANVVQQLISERIGDSRFSLTKLYPQNIRNLMAQDKFSRASLYADKDFRSQLKAIFGDDLPDPNKPIYLGSYSSNVTVDDVTATSAGEIGNADYEKSIIGQIAGKVKQGGEDGNVFSRDFNEDGIIIGMHYVMPRNNYDSYRLDKFNTKISRFDYYYPQFDGLGMQPLLAYERNLEELNAPSNIGTPYAKASSLFGFVPRYYEYKQRTNEVHGIFQSKQSDDAWTLSNNGQYGSADGVVLDASNPVNYKILPNITDRIFITPYDGSQATDPFWHYYYFDVTLVSDMEVFGTPSL